MAGYLDLIICHFIHRAEIQKKRVFNWSCGLNGTNITNATPSISVLAQCYPMSYKTGLRICTKNRNPHCRLQVQLQTKMQQTRSISSFKRSKRDQKHRHAVLTQAKGNSCIKNTVSFFGFEQWLLKVNHDPHSQKNSSVGTKEIWPLFP